MSKYSQLLTQALEAHKKPVILLDEDNSGAAIIYTKLNEPKKYNIHVIKSKTSRKLGIFKTAESEEQIRKCFNNLIQNYNNAKERQDHIKANRIQGKQEFLNSLKIGTILYSSWGYEQTNVDFYVVTKINNSKVTIIEIAHNMEENKEKSWAYCYVMPDMSKTLGKEETHIVRSNHIKISSSQYLSLWDGKPQYKSWYY